jgi:hypothetical protein
MTNTRLGFQRYFLATFLAAWLVAGCSGSSTELGHLAQGGGASGNRTGGSGGAGGNSAGNNGGGTGANNTGGSAVGAGGGGAGGKNTGGDNLPDAGMSDALSAATAESFCLSYYGYAYQLLGICFGINASLVQLLPAVVCKPILQSVGTGHIVYDRASGATCLSELAAVWPPTAAFCASSDTPPGDCASALVPQVPLAGACATIDPDYGINECAGGGYCDEGSVLYACSGTCKSFLDVGAACTFEGQQCTSGTTCTASMLSPGQCVSRVGAGQSCEGPGGPECLSPTRCVGGSATVAGVCQTPPTSGPCAYSYECARSTVCAGPSGNRQCSPPKQNGATCTPGNSECSASSHCTAAGICDDHLGVEGEPCGTILGELVACQYGFTCDATSVTGSGTCHAQKAPGATCTGTIGECSGYHGHCDSATLKCVSCDRG